MDIYNLFNSDAALGYDTPTVIRQRNGTWVPHNHVNINGVETTDAGYGTVNKLVSPRFARFQVQFDF